jgi:hypothetical protein
MKRFALPGGTLLLAGLLALGGCSAPDDEIWMRITGIGLPVTTTTTTEDTTTTTTTIENRSVFESNLRDGTTDTADVEVQNFTVILGGSDVGVSIAVYSATVELFTTGHLLRSFTYPVTLFLPAPAAGEAGVAATTAVLRSLPLVPAALKAWILNPDTFPADIAAAGFTAEAKITLRGRTEEGRELETSASVTVVFN